MDSKGRLSQKGSKRQREEESVDMEASHKSLRLSRQHQTQQDTANPTTKETQKATTLKKAKKQKSSKISADTNAPENSDNKAKFIEALQFVRKESRRCQVCSTTYDEVDKAHDCLHSHKNSFENAKFRCYLCFNLFKDTDMLFEHYKSEHRHAEGMENTLLCNCCDKKINYKNVSVHVISQHAVPQIQENFAPKINSVENLEEKYKDEIWRYDQAKRCHGCSKTFLTIPAAMECLKSHRLLRCYFCFSTFEKTHKLFEHYKCTHNQGKSKNSVVCECCDESATHKAAVTHVINFHLTKVI